MNLASRWREPVRPGSFHLRPCPSLSRVKRFGYPSLSLRVCAKVAVSRPCCVMQKAMPARCRASANRVYSLPALSLLGGVSAFTSMKGRAGTLSDPVLPWRSLAVAAGKSSARPAKSGRLCRRRAWRAGLTRGIAIAKQDRAPQRISSVTVRNEMQRAEVETRRPTSRVAPNE
jgi:hypothetical protein